MSLAEVQQDEAPLWLDVVTVNDLPRVWHVIEPVLTRACEESRGEFSVPGVLAEMGLHDGVERWRLLVLSREQSVLAVMVVCVSQVGERRVLDCLLASGESAKEWPRVDDQLDAYAREWGCTTIRIPHARKGWARTLPHWKITGYCMARDI